jgi:flagellar basal-body rod modification protein FlgD
MADTSTSSISTGSAASTQGTQYTKESGTSSLYGLGKDDFLKLFLAQLKNQDPTQPLDNSEMVNQLAQFSLIDTLQQVETAMAGTQMAQASSLIGKTVTGKLSSGSTITGVVDRVTQANGTISVLVNGTSLTSDQILEVKATA